MPYTEKNIEDWDFRHATPGDDPEYNLEADLFLSEHYLTVLDIESFRLSKIRNIIEYGWAQVHEGGEHAKIADSHIDDYLKGMKSGYSRITHRFERRVIESLRREFKKHGRVRLALLSDAQRPK